MVLTVLEAEFGWSFSLCCTYLKRILQIYPIYTDEQHKKKAKREKNDYRPKGLQTKSHRNLLLHVLEL